MFESGSALGYGTFVNPMGASPASQVARDVTLADVGSVLRTGVRNTAKYALGATEFVLGGAYNGVVHLAGAAGSIPYLLDSTDAAVGVQEGVAELYGYDLRSSGAKDIASGLGSAVTYVDKHAITPSRDWSTEHIGDAGTTILFGGVRATVEIGSLFVPGSRSVVGSTRGVEAELALVAREAEAAANAARIRANVKASRQAREASEFPAYAERESLVQEAIATNQSPWPLGYTPRTRMMSVGEQFNMVVDENQMLGKYGPGNFGTFAEIPDLLFARNDLAITTAFKSDKLMLYRQKFEVIQDFPALAGPVGPQIGRPTGGLFPGNKAVEQLHLNLASTDRINYIRPVGAPLQLH